MNKFWVLFKFGVGFEPEIHTSHSVAEAKLDALCHANPGIKCVLLESIKCRIAETELYSVTLLP